MFKSEDLESRIVEIYHNHYVDVYRFLIYFSGNQNDAEDLTQEVFIRLLKSLRNYNTNQSLKTWILSIAKHVAIDHYRRRRIASVFKDGFFKQLESEDKKPDELLEHNEVKRMVHEAISKLKTNYRTVVILRGINEFSIKETADILGCSDSKVKVDYHRALKELKRRLNMDEEEVMKNAN